MSTRESTHNFKIVAVGDGAVGKTCLLVCYAEHRFPREYVPTIFENYHSNIKSKDEVVRLSIYDTAGQEDFNIAHPLSLKNVKAFWAKDIKESGPKGSLVILVGTMEDLREDATILRDLKKEGKSTVTREEAMGVAKEIGAICYMETSAKMMRGVTEVFEKAVDYCMKKAKPNRKSGLSGGEEKSGLFGSSSKKEDADEDLLEFERRWGK